MNIWFCYFHYIDFNNKLNCKKKIHCHHDSTVCRVSKKKKKKRTGFVVINEIAKKQNKNLMARFRLLYYYFNTVYEQNLSDQFFQMKWEIVE